MKLTDVGRVALTVLGSWDAAVAGIVLALVVYGVVRLVVWIF